MCEGKVYVHLGGPELGPQLGLGVRLGREAGPAGANLLGVKERVLALHQQHGARDEPPVAPDEVQRREGAAVPGCSQLCVRGHPVKSACP